MFFQDPIWTKHSPSPTSRLQSQGKERSHTVPKPMKLNMTPIFRSMILSLRIQTMTSGTKIMKIHSTEIS